MIIYTKPQLQIQLDVAKRHLASEVVLMEQVMSPDWQLAKEFGEDIRQNHVKTINMRMVGYEARIYMLEMRIGSM